jgi:hypothetical protein
MFCLRFRICWAFSRKVFSSFEMRSILNRGGGGDGLAHEGGPRRDSRRIP